MSEKYDICVVGLGYIGLPTSSIFATKGKRVLGVDVSQGVVDTINEGRIHIEEPDLDVLVRAAVQSGNLQASVTPAKAEVYIIAVPTPFHEEGDGSRQADLSYVEAATRAIAPFVQEGSLVILESTSPVGTTEKMRDWLLEERKESDAERYHFVHCPERILPGQMLKELVTNDRIAGGLTREASLKAKELYECFCTAEIFLTDARTAELAKLTENSFRDVNIAFANELSVICDTLGVSVWELIKLANRHPRVNILTPGPGVGGHCIAVDPWFIVDAAGDKAKLIRTAREVNDAKPGFVVEQVRKKAKRFKEPVIACLGLAFKADVDDLRESPALGITELICELGLGRVLVVEPYVSELPKNLSKKAELTSLEQGLKEADVVVLLVDHRIFAEVPREKLHDKVLIDTRGCWYSGGS